MLDDAKAAADARMKEHTPEKLGAFTERINSLLEMLCADFSLAHLGTERGGGATGARFTLRVPAGTFEVASSEGEQRFARVLSDGDRSTLAFAIFLLTLEALPDLGEHVVIFDDPMTSQDSQRTESTAEHITKLAVRAKQVIVLSHHDQFLGVLANDWRRHYKSQMKELVEVELEKGSGALRPWSSSEQLKSEQLRRLEDIDTFVRTRADRQSERIQGEIRKALEAHVRSLYPDLFDNATTTLEPVIRKLQKDEHLRAATTWSVEDIKELDRLCGFGARGNHDGSSLNLPVPSPETVRSMAQRLLRFIRQPTN